MNYFKESIEEWRKITWPTRNQSVRLTIITVVFTFVTAAVLALVDNAFSFGYEYLLDISPKVQEQAAGVDVNIDNTPSEPIEVNGVEATTVEGEPIEIVPEVTPESE